MKWQLYYADGSVYTDEDGKAQDSPKDFLVAVYQEIEPFGRSIVRGDYFTFRERWYGHDLYGLIDQMKHHAHDIEAVRPGYYADDKTYKEVLGEQQAQNLTPDHVYVSDGLLDDHNSR